MRRRHLIKSLIALLLLSFVGQGIGQTFASAARQCQFGAMPPQEHRQEHRQEHKKAYKKEHKQEKQLVQQMLFSNVMDHSMHLSVLNSQDLLAAPEHCQSCDCSTGNCGSAVLPTSHSLFTQAPVAQYLTYSALTTSELVISLYRPPIFR